MGHLDDLFGLSGRVALVTGASSGLGTEAATALARAGARVGLVARRRDRLEAVAKDLEALGVRATAAAADITDPEQVEAVIERIEAELGPIDILVQAAGVAPLSRASKHSLDKWNQAISVNLTSAFLVSQGVGRRMIEAERGGSIILFSSVIGFGGNPVHRAVGYAASKGGLNNLTRHLAIEWAEYGVRVNAIAPAYFPTEMTRDPRIGDVAPEQVEVMRTFTPMRRLGRPGEISTAVLFLASPASSYVTGAIVPVDGGWTAW